MSSVSITKSSFSGAYNSAIKLCFTRQHGIQGLSLGGQIISFSLEDKWGDPVGYFYFLLLCATCLNTHRQTIKSIPLKRLAMKGCSPSHSMCKFYCKFSLH